MPLVVKDRRVLLNNRPILFYTYELIPKAQSLASNGPMSLSLSLYIYIYIIYIPTTEMEFYSVYIQ